MPTPPLGSPQPMTRAEIMARVGLPTSTTDNTVPRFNGVTGAMQTSGVTISDADRLTAGGGVVASGDADSLYIVDAYNSHVNGSGVRIRLNTDGNNAIQVRDSADAATTFQLQGNGAITTQNFATFGGAVTATSASGVTTRPAATQDAMRIAGRAGGTSSYVATIAPPALSASITLTTPATTTTLAGLSVAQTFTAVQSISTSSGTALTVVSGQSTVADIICQGAATTQGWLQFGTADYGIQGGADYAGLVLRANGASRVTIGTTGAVAMSSTATVAGAAAVRGTSLIGALTVVTASETAPQSIAAWDATKHVLLAGPGAATTSTALAVSVDQSASECDLIALTPGTAWRDLRLRAAAVSILINGSTSPTLTVNSTGLVLATTTAGTVAGGLQVESNQDKLYTYANGLGGWIDRCIFSQYAAVTQSGIVTAQSLASGTARGTRTLPANFFKVGKVLKFRLCGVYTTDAVPGNATISINLGGTTFRTTGSFSLDASVTDGYWILEGEITCASTGGTGTVIGQVAWIHAQTSPPAESAMYEMPMTTFGAVTVDTTASAAFDVVWTATDAGTSITCSCFRLWEVC